METACCLQYGLFRTRLAPQHQHRELLDRLQFICRSSVSLAMKVRSPKILSVRDTLSMISMRMRELRQASESGSGLLRHPMREAHHRVI